jgi:putative endonuclease
MYFVYILECEDKTLYTGITTDLERRFKEHKDGIGSHYTKAHKASRVIYKEECADRSNASKRELEIKKWSRLKKLEMIENSK